MTGSSVTVTILLRVLGYTILELTLTRGEYEELDADEWSGGGGSGSLERDPAPLDPVLPRFDWEFTERKGFGFQ